MFWMLCIARNSRNSILYFSWITSKLIRKIHSINEVVVACKVGQSRKATKSWIRKESHKCSNTIVFWCFASNLIVVYCFCWLNIFYFAWQLEGFALIMIWNWLFMLIYHITGISSLSMFLLDIKLFQPSKNKRNWTKVLQVYSKNASIKQTLQSTNTSLVCFYRHVAT